jgi:hypothetical protein
MTILHKALDYIRSGGYIFRRAPNSDEVYVSAKPGGPYMPLPNRVVTDVRIDLDRCGLSHSKEDVRDLLEYVASCSPRLTANDLAAPQPLQTL